MGGEMEDLQLLTISRLKSFRTCKRLHYFRYEACRRPLVDKEELRFGTLWHKAMEGWWGAHKRGLGSDAYQFGLAAMAEHVAGSAGDDFDEETLLRAEELLLGYDARWAGAMLDIEVVAVESEFCMPLRNPDTGRASVTFALGGKIDVRVRKRSTGRAWIVEHKTTNMDIGPASDYWLKLRMDGQVSVYYDGAGSLKDDVEGCIYDVVRKPMLRLLRATPEEDRKFTKGKACKACKGLGAPGEMDACAPCSGTGWLEAPRLYAGQRDHDETIDEYRERLRVDIAGNPENYFQHGELVRLEQEMVEHRRDVWWDARHIRDAQLANSHTRNPDACHMYNQTCSYYQVCTGAASIDDDGMFRDSRQHEELGPKEEGAHGNGNEPDPIIDPTTGF
jgi:hypothetical protein